MATHGWKSASPDRLVEAFLDEFRRALGEEDEVEEGVSDDVREAGALYQRIRRNMSGTAIPASIRADVERLDGMVARLGGTATVRADREAVIQEYLDEACDFIEGHLRRIAGRE